MTLTRSDREQMLKKISTAVADKYYDPHFHGKDWKRTVARHEQSIINADSDRAYESAVSELLNELGSSCL